MANIKIAVINESTVVNDNDVNKVVASLQKQVHQHFAPAWGIDADLTVVAKTSSPDKGTWWLVILDNSDQAGALGYHDMTNEGLPLGKVFASTDLQYGQKWSVTASHELLEMLGDPDINLSALVEDDANGSGTLYAYEVCDACEADDDGYDIDGVQVSDFVYPTWFETMWSNASVDSVQFDYMKHVSAPFELRPGGYIGIYNIKSGSGWTQKTADGDITYDQRPRVGSRRERRRTSRLHWQRSKAIQLIGQRRKELAEACGK